MFGWLKFVGLAGNFASLPPRFYASVALERERERAELTKYDEDGESEVRSERIGERERGGIAGREGEIVAVAVTLHRGILIRVGGRV